MRRYTALRLIALAASSTAAPLELKLAQTPPAHRLSIPEVYGKLVQKKNSAFEVATEFKNQLKSRVFEYRSGLADVRAAVTGDHARRRRLGVLDTYASDIESIGEAFSNGETMGMDDLHNRFKGISCTNGEPNANLMNAIDEELREAVETSLELVPTIRKSFRCLCASSWELGGSDQMAMHNAIKALIDGNDGSSYWTSLIVAAKNTLPLYMGSNGLCAEPCKEMFVALFQLGFSFAEDEEVGGGANLPATPKAEFPGTSISCMCGMQWETMLPTLFPKDDEWATIESMERLLEDGLERGSNSLLTLATRAAAFMDWWTMDSTNLCSTDCKTTIQLGTTLGIYAGSRIMWPEWAEDSVPSASDGDNPTEAELESLGMSMTGAMCSAKMTTASSMVLAAREYIVGDRPFPEDASSLVAMLELMAKTYYSPTDYGEGACNEVEYRNMWAKMAKLGTRHAVKLLENLWEGETEWEHRLVQNQVMGYNSTCMPICEYGRHDSTGNWVDTGSTYNSWKCEQGGCRKDTLVNEWEWVYEEYKEEDTRIFSPGGLTVAELNGMIDDFFHCYCDYWTGPGDVFPLIESKIKQYEETEPDDWGVEIADLGRLGMQSAKTCKSNNCRSMFDSVFAMVEKLSGTSLTQGITFNGAPACDAAGENAKKCWGGVCWPINQESVTGECKVCYAPTEPSSTLYPMAHMDDIADRIMFWSSCSMSTDCPPPDVSSYQLKFTLSASTSEEAFTATKQELLKKRIADLLNQEPGLEGAVSADDVTLIIAGSGSGLEVEVVTNVYSETVKEKAITTLTTLADPSTASSKLGTSLLTINDAGNAAGNGGAFVSAVNVAFSPPLPPPPPFAPPPSPSVPPGGGTDDKLSAAALAGIIVGTIAGLCCCFLGCALAFFFYQKLQKQKMKKSTVEGANKSTPGCEPAAVTVEMKNPVSLKLEKLDLEQYASALVDEQGYDTLASLEGLTAEQAGELADAVKMKPGHKKRFIDAIV